MLVGREDECARVDRSLAQAREGVSAVLLLRGEAGIGKSALCRYATEHAGGMTVLATRGTESEAELPYAGLADLFRPVLDCLEAIPAPQAAALAGALAIAPAAAAERFTVAAATLSLLAAAAESGPLLVVIDDAHWLDRPSAQALSFAARRLFADRVALLVTARSEYEPPLDLAGATELTLTGLDLTSSTELLRRTAPTPVATPVAQRVHQATDGNPLALIEACGLLTERQLAGREGFHEPLPASAGLEAAFLRRVTGLPRATQRALVIAATSDSDEIAAVAVAISSLGIAADALEVAEGAGLLRMTDHGVVFRHPLLRSAVYHRADAGERRAAHRALAAALADERSRDRQVWHLAAAATAPDEQVAAELEHAARDARSRRAHGAAASAFERAAQLTPDPGSRARRLLEAATDLQLSGASDAALGLLDRALACAEGPLLRARVQQLRGRIEIWRGRLSVAHELLVSEATAVRELDRSQAALMLAEACLPCLLAIDCTLALETAERASEMATGGSGIAEVVSGILLGEALIMAGETQPGRALLLRNCAVLEATDPLAAGLHELLGTAAVGLTFAEEYAVARRLLDGAIGAARVASAPGALPWLLACRAQLDHRTGRWHEAYAAAFEAAQLAVETDQVALRPPALACSALIEAAEGRDAECRAHSAQVLAFGQSHDIATWRAHGGAILGLLELGLRRPAEAIDWLEPVAAFALSHGVGEPACLQWAPDLIEAYVHAGRDDDAATTLAALERQATHTGGTWALAAAARCHGLLAEEDTFEEYFSAALHLHDRTPTPFERARTQLCRGERLRRSGLRVEAREQLRPALVAFESLGAAPWAHRTRTELHASGETARRRDHSSRERLTPRELQVALVVAEGATNNEAAASLFLTPKTIEFHLGNIYRKLGIRSRSELARLFASGAEDAAPTVSGIPA
jgi:DNA-binding CsgD family transcriptional regulator